MKRVILTCILIFFALTPCQSQENSESKAIWTPELSIDCKEIESVEVSPNGEHTLIGYRDKDKDLKVFIRFCVISNKDKKILFTTPKGSHYIKKQRSPKRK